MQNQPSFWTLERSNLLIAIAGLFFTAFFSIVTWRLGETANNLAHKSVELSESDTLQNRQLEELKNLYKNAQNQIAIQSEQLSGIHSLLLNASQHYNFDTTAFANIRLGGLYKLKYALERIRSDLFYESMERLDIMAFDQEKKMKLIFDLEIIASGEMTNPYLISHKELLAYWQRLLIVCQTTKKAIEYDGITTDSIFKVIGSDTVRIYSTSKHETSGAFNYFVEEVYKFWDYNQKKIFAFEIQIRHQWPSTLMETYHIEPTLIPENK